MRYQVPQFIEVEDKIFGRITLKQFIYIAGGCGISFIIYNSLPSLMYAILPISIVMTIALLLAFFRYNNKPFINIVEYAYKYAVSTKLYIWKKVPVNKTDNAVQEAKEYAKIMVPRISDSKLKDLTWSLDIKESMYTNQNQK